MARIKFLDILEETKSKPIYKESHSNHAMEESMNVPSSTVDPIELPRKRDRIPIMEAQDKLADLRERSLLRDSGVSFEGATATATMPSMDRRVKSSMSEASNFLGMDDNKMLLTGALFVFFGGMLFLSGYWVGKTITNSVRAEREMLMAQSMNNIKKAVVPVGLPALPETSTVDTIPTKQPLEVVEPATIEPVVKKAKVAKPAPRPVVSKEYVIQISAHSTIESARAVEDKLREAGFTAYTSESTIGDSMFFRVRVRGFSSKQDAQDTLTQIKEKNLGQDGFILTLE